MRYLVRRMNVKRVIKDLLIIMQHFHLHWIFVDRELMSIITRIRILSDDNSDSKYERISIQKKKNGLFETCSDIMTLERLSHIYFLVLGNPIK